MNDFLAGMRAAVETDDPPTKPRTRTRERSSRDRPKRTPNPPNRVEPGWLHDAASAAILKSLQNRKVDVGVIADDFLSAIPGQDDSPEPAVLLARILAHVGHRIPGFRRVEKRLEGREARAGLASDLTALALQLYFRNRDLVAATVKTYREQRLADIGKADAAKSAQNEGVSP